MVPALQVKQMETEYLGKEWERSNVSHSTFN